jgi:hypothetical protein
MGMGVYHLLVASFECGTHVHTYIYGIYGSNVTDYLPAEVYTIYSMSVKHNSETPHIPEVLAELLAVNPQIPALIFEP